jgi:hypothetical protein
MTSPAIRLVCEGFTTREATRLLAEVRLRFTEGLGVEDIAVRLEIDPVVVAWELDRAGLWARTDLSNWAPGVRVGRRAHV